MNFRRALVAATILAMPIAASAQPVTGIYLGAGAGPDIPLNQDVKNLQLTNGALGGLSTSGKAKFGVGFTGQASLGYGFGNGLRAEVEGVYLNNKGNGFTDFTRTNGLAGGGTQQKYGVMVNGLYDFNGLSPMFVPYVGVGVGALWVNDDLHARNTSTFSYGGNTLTPGGFTAQTNGTTAVFAYQAIVGFSVPVPSVPGLALTADYRFLGTAGNRTDSANYNVSVSGQNFHSYGRVQMGPTYDNQIMFGVRYNFGQAPAPAPVPVAPPPAPIAKSYLVFFDWDKATLTDRARQIIAEAAANSKKVQTTRIEVNGYTDTSGTPKYNMGLSIRRAQAVAAELVRNGVPKQEISIQGFGDTHLLVPTGPGVREPQNRRVEIILH
ncbi:OmpA family protein [Rhodopila sp.]|jgi:outer membrane protein OmpA-like peptidoglycan-associated protein|uniref:OmpA family protein n=1 Tax=Rhodopila sp. TaxID=2480087 RepID=UPI002C8E4910|nr:OmpA family protein [Rhodopila sp.]HVZ07732.1 OmpA family protein [Rhodopila sp.]